MALNPSSSFAGPDRALRPGTLVSERSVPKTMPDRDKVLSNDNWPFLISTRGSRPTQPQVK